MLNFRRGKFLTNTLLPPIDVARKLRRQILSFYGDCASFAEVSVGRVLRNCEAIARQAFSIIFRGYMHQQRRDVIRRFVGLEFILLPGNLRISFVDNVNRVSFGDY